MSLFDGVVEGTPPLSSIALRPNMMREQPGFFTPAALWLYGNVQLLQQQLSHVDEICGKYHFDQTELKAIEAEAERIVLGGQILVCGVHNEAHMRSALVPLRWGSPRIVVFSGGFQFHLGEDLNQEPFSAARLWRHQWDPITDLAVSRRSPEKRPTYAHRNPTVDRLITEIALKQKDGLFSLCPLLEKLAQ